MHFPLWRRVAASFVAALFAITLAACGDSGTEPASPTTSTVATKASPDGTSIDRSNSGGAAPGDGSGQNKTPEGNSNSGDSPTGTLTK